jgi:hypothetical protein
MSGFKSKKSNSQTQKKKHQKLDFGNITENVLVEISKWLSDSYNYNQPKIFEEKYGMKYINHIYNPRTGFAAIAMKKDNDIYFLCPGTKNYQDYLNDLMLFLNFTTLQMKYDVEHFFESTLTEYVSKYHKVPENIYSFGHSLGAINSDFLVASVLTKEYLITPKLQSITVENPGSLTAVKKILKKWAPEKYSKYFQIFNSEPNGINSSKKHVTPPHIVQLHHLRDKFNHIDQSRDSETVKMFVKLPHQHGIDSFVDDNITITHNYHPDHKWSDTSRMRELTSAVYNDLFSITSACLRNAVTSSYNNFDISKQYLKISYNAVYSFCSNLESLELSGVTQWLSGAETE